MLQVINMEAGKRMPRGSSTWINIAMRERASRLAADTETSPFF